MRTSVGIMVNHRREMAAGVALAGLTGLVFSTALRCGFVRYDDYSYVVENPRLRAGWSWDTLSWAFTSFDDALWAPLMRLSHLLDVSLFGLHPAGHHLSSVLLHAANAMLAFFVLRKLTGAPWAAWLAAALFALHPLRVEPVVWIAARKEVLFVCGALMTLLAYDGYAKRPGLARYCAVTVAFALALMAKPMAVTLPCVLALLDYWPYGRLAKHRIFRAAIEKVPWLGLSAGVSLLTLMAERVAMMPPGFMSWHTRAGNAVMAYGLYAWKTVVPYPLYIPVALTPDFAPGWKTALAAAFLLAATLSALLLVRKAPYLLTGWLWFLGALIPVIGLIPFGHHAMADRFVYFPHLGIALLAAAAGSAVRRFPATRSAMLLLAVGVLTVYGALTPLQIRVWRDTGTLFGNTLARDPDNYAGLCNYGKVLMEQNRFAEAAALYQRAGQLRPNNEEVLNDLAVAYLGMNRTEDAIAILSRLLERHPGDAEMQVNLGVAYYAAGRLDQARACARRALELAPGFDKADLLLNRLNPGKTQP